MKNNIAEMLKLPGAVMDGRWHVLTIDGQEFEYIASNPRQGHGEAMYRHKGGFGCSNAPLSLGGHPDSFSLKLGRYLAPAHKRARFDRKAVEEFTALGQQAKLEDHRPMKGV